MAPRGQFIDVPAPSGRLEGEAMPRGVSYHQLEAQLWQARGLLARYRQEVARLDEQLAALTALLTAKEREIAVLRDINQVGETTIHRLIETAQANRELLRLTCERWEEHCGRLFGEVRRLRRQRCRLPQFETRGRRKLDVVQ